MRRFVLPLSILLLAGCATVTPPINVDISAKPPIDEKSSSVLEKKMGQAGYYHVLLTFKFVDDQRLINRLHRIGARLAHYTERPHIKYKFFVLDTKYRNAFSLPDGYIFITEPFIDKLKDDEKIAWVIAHEMAHITHKHGLEQYKRWQNLPRSILGRRIFKVTTEMARKRAYELQADQTSLRYMYRAGYNPEVALETMEILKQIEKEDREEYEKDKDKKKKLELAPMGHPYIENRIVNARDFLMELPASEKVQYNPEDFTF